MSDPSVGRPVGEPPEAPPTKRSKRSSRSSTRNMVEWALVIVGAIVVAFVVKTFLIQAFQIPSASMHPTLLEGDRVLVNKLSYDLHDVNRGDVIVFARPKGMNAGPNDPDDLIKRVIGLPGDTVQTKDGDVYVNGRQLEEPYLADGTVSDGLDDPVTIPDGHVWVMGDNRGDSQDSRVFGPIAEDTIVGRAFMVMWPPSRMGSL
ncbi:signal peptidase I [Dermatobacter hominis]|uniref:signal peptidase I n=1 Tax=Dermatobacter hominis TaxID=2884263 RepID=UPI001D0FAB27|nr:signal peptidase I [Dermatobacter hominis]UDY36385.1 signal peptidase I [Dermatobacter hominis]